MLPGMRPEPARSEDLEPVLELIRASGLPVEGVADAFPGGYAVVRDADLVVAVAGLERHGACGLLRSVAVSPSLRSTGIGRALVSNRLAVARASGLDRVYLLTTTAAPFFRRLGFDESARDTAPQELQRSLEFSQSCPATAVCMSRRPPSPSEVP